MANWLESLEQFGSAVVDAGSEAVASRIKSEIAPDAPNNPKDRPETQYNTQIQTPVDGPESMKPKGGAGQAFSEVWGQYKWWIVGGVAITGYLAIRGSR